VTDSDFGYQQLLEDYDLRQWQSAAELLQLSQQIQDHGIRSPFQLYEAKRLLGEAVRARTGIVQLAGSTGGDSDSAVVAALSQVVDALEDAIIMYEYGGKA